MKRVSTMFLKAVILFMSLAVLAICVFALPSLGKEAEDPRFVAMLKPILISMYITLVPLLFAFYQTFKLLNYIDTNQAFSNLSVKVLQNIKYCAIAIAVIYTATLPFFYRLADIDDAPGLVIVGMFFVFAPMVIAMFAAVLQKLFQNALDMKAENELTV